MPLDPQKQIEDLLKASARERRDKFSAEPKMPGPMRTQLQAEIARMNEPATPSEGAGWFFQWWPRLAIAAFVTLLVSLPLYRELSRQKPALATAERSARDESKSSADHLAVNKAPGVERDAKLSSDSTLSEVREPAKSVASGTLDGRKAGDDAGELAFSDSLEKKFDEKPASAPAVAAQAVQSEMAATDSGRPAMQKFANIQLQDKNAMAASNASIAQNAIGEQSKLKRQLANSPLRQEFRANLKVKQAVNMLNSFQFEQTGNSIRIYDADGSTYSGEIHPLAAKDSDREDRSRSAAGYAAKSKVESAGQQNTRGLAEGNGFYFRAEGANRSLNKSVVIEGNYIEQPQVVTAPAGTAVVGGAVQTQSPQTGARIVGHAKINGSPEVEIDADSIPQR